MRHSRPNLAYWQTSAKRSPRSAPTIPLDPLSTWQIVGLILFAALVAGLILLSIGWWIHAVAR